MHAVHSVAMLGAVNRSCYGKLQMANIMPMMKAIVVPIKCVLDLLFPDKYFQRYRMHHNNHAYKQRALFWCGKTDCSLLITLIYPMKT